MSNADTTTANRNLIDDMTHLLCKRIPSFNKIRIAVLRQNSSSFTDGLSQTVSCCFTVTLHPETNYSKASQKCCRVQTQLFLLLELQAVAQHQFFGIGVHVVLLIDVGLGIFTQVVFEQGDGHDQRDLAEAVFFQYFEQFLLVVAI